jgi:hypothetical protein
MIIKLHLCLRVRQLNLKKAQNSRNEFTHRRHLKVSTDTCLSSTEGKHILIHIRSSIGIKPAIRIEVIGIGAENGRIAVDDPRVDSDD